MTFWRSYLTDAMGEQACKKGAVRPLLLWPFYRRTPLRKTRPTATGGALFYRNTPQVARLMLPTTSCQILYNNVL